MEKLLQSAFARFQYSCNEENTRELALLLNAAIIQYHNGYQTNAVAAAAYPMADDGSRVSYEAKNLKCPYYFTIINPTDERIKKF